MQQFINLTNHPSSNWTGTQLAAAQAIGPITDIAFPEVDEQSSAQQIDALAEEYLAKVKTAADGHPCTVHVMGEMTFTYRLVTLLKEAGYKCVASTSQRMVEEQADGTKKRFEFCQFREY